MANDVLSVIPYFGGKARMTPLICEMLDYDNTDIYIEPFGGGARVLLNKPRHKIDIYNDSSLGLNALFECLSNEKTGQELIDQLLDTEPSEELFNWALEFRNSFDDDLQTIAYNKLKAFVKKMSDKYGFDPLRRAFRGRKNGDDTSKDIEKDIATIEPLRKKMSAVENEEFISLCKDYLNVYDSKPINEKGVSYYDDLIELAKATFIVYHLSYNATGNGFSRPKGENIEGYYKNIDNLYRAMYQLEGIKTVCSDAKLAFLQDVGAVVELGDGADTTECTFSEYLRNPKVMMYLDPTYLQADVRFMDEDGTVPCDKSCMAACRALQEKHDKDATEKDLGENAYKQSWSHREHEKFLRLIYGADCHILVSNYDVCLYNRYLSEDNNWHKIEFETTTAIVSNSTKDNNRTEVLWYNY